MLKRIKYLSLYLFTIINCTCISYADELHNFKYIINIGEKFVEGLSLALAKSIIIISIIKILNVYISKKNMQERISKIIRECISVLLFLYIIPRISTLVSMILS